MTIDCDIIHRDGKGYARMRTIHLQLLVTHLTLKGTYEDVGPFISGIINEILDSNWKILMESMIPDMEVYMGDIIKSFFIPIFDKIALEDFSDGQSFLETYPVELDSDSPSSISSSTVVQKSISNALVWIAFVLTKQFGV